VLWVKKYVRAGDVVLAVADEELMGREFEENELVLRVGSFYRGELVREEQVKSILRDATIINAVGERAVQALIEAGLAVPGAEKRVQGVPHLQVVLYFR